MMDKKQQNSNNTVNQVVNAYISDRTKFDPQGSYTGVPKEKGEKPVQDADDL